MTGIPDHIRYGTYEQFARDHDAGDYTAETMHTLQSLLTDALKRLEARGSRRTRSAQEETTCGTCWDQQRAVA